MDGTNYAQGLDIISETAKQYSKLRDSYAEKDSEKIRVESRIAEIEDRLATLLSQVLSIDEIKKDAIDSAENNYHKKVNDANLWYENTISTIDSSAENDVNVKKSIEQSCMIDTDRAYAKVESAKKQVEECATQLNIAQIKNDDLEQQIANSSTEESKIKLCALHIQPEYSNVKYNVEFQQDYGDPRGVTEEEAISKFATLPAKKIKKIAQKMNTGRYVSSPDESRGLPLMEILFMAVATLWIVIKGIFKGIGFIYIPMRYIYDITKKIVYGAVASIILFLLVFFVATKFGDGIVTILFLLLLVVLSVLVGMILYNIVKFSNKAFRKEQNLEYYTVGYYFTFREDEILLKIASNYYSELKEKNPAELESLLNATFGTLQSQKDSAMLEVNTCNERLSVAQRQLVSEELTFQNEKEELENKCKIAVEEILAKLSADRETEKCRAKELLEKTLTDCAREKDELKNNAEKNAIDTFRIRESEIESTREELSKTKEALNGIINELSQISSEADDARIRNNGMVDECMNADIDPITDRKDGDRLPTTLNVGLCESQYNNLRTNNIESIYTKRNINANSDGWKPMIITCDIEDDGSNDVTKRYYSIIDSMISDILGKTYLKAFRFTIVDKQQSKAGLVSAMDQCRDQFDQLEGFDCIKLMLNERSDKCFEEIISEQARLLNGKDINEVNQTTYKGSDNMVKHVFACVRLYRKLSDFNFKEFRRMIQTAKDNGIIPLFLMSSDYFNDVIEDLKGTMKDYCDNTYYVLDINSNKRSKVINLTEKKL